MDTPEVPKLLLPFEPSLERVVRYLNSIAKPELRMEIASCDVWYEPSTHAELDRFLSGEETSDPLYRLRDCADLISNGGRVLDASGFVGGGISLILGTRDYETALASEGRLGRMTQYAVDYNSSACDMIVDLCGWMTDWYQREENMRLYSAQSFSGFAMLAAASRIASEPNGVAQRQSVHKWIDSNSCNQLSNAVERLIDREMNKLTPDATTTRRWFVDLDSTFQMCREWWQLCSTLKPMLSPELTGTRRLIDRVLADSYDLDQ